MESECIQCTAQHHRDVMQRVDYVSFSPFNPWYIVDIFKGCYAIARRCERTAIIITTTSIVLNCVSARILCPRGDKIIRNYDVIWFATDTLYYIIRLGFEKRKKKLESIIFCTAVHCTGRGNDLNCRCRNHIILFGRLITTRAHAIILWRVEKNRWSATVE